MPYQSTRRLPSQNPANAISPNDGTGNLYGMQDSIALMPTEHRLVDLGVYFTAQNPTVGTYVQIGAAGAGNSSFSATVAMFTINNTDSASATNKRIYFRGVDLHLGGTAPTATVSLESNWVIDTVSRAPTAGNVAITPINQTPISGASTIAAVQAYTGNANLTVPSAGASAKSVGRVAIPTGLGVVGDVYKFTFGGNVDPTSAGSTSGSTRTTASAPGVFVGNGDPIVIEPGQWLVAHIWWLTHATTAPSFEYKLSWYEL